MGSNTSGLKKGGNPAWVKGVSGNPNGRPKGISAQIRELTDDLKDQIKEIVRLSLHAKSEKVRLEAAGMLFDRVLGKALETHVTADLSEEGKLAMLNGLTLSELADLARGRPLSAGSSEVVEAPALVLQEPETLVPNTQSGGSEGKPLELERAESTPEPE